MNEFLEKLSSYNIFNYLFPGIVFVILLSKLTAFSLIQDDLALGIFLYYFIGLTVSRFGSLLMEPLLKSTRLISFSDYGDFIKAAKKDEKLEVLSEVNNMYRTISALFVLIILAKFYEMVLNANIFLKPWSPWIIITGIVILFFFSYKKQTDYIVKRVAHFIGSK